jgi:hypothetical protein
MTLYSFPLTFYLGLAFEWSRFSADSIMSKFSICSFTKSTEFNKLLMLTQSEYLKRIDSSLKLAGQARISLQISEILKYLRVNHLTPELDTPASKFWLVSI